MHDSTMRPATPEETRAALLDLGRDPATPFTVDVRHRLEELGWRRPPSWFARLLGRG